VNVRKKDNGRFELRLANIESVRLEVAQSIGGEIMSASSAVPESGRVELTLHAVQKMK
jgi:hypothetical protein